MSGRIYLTPSQVGHLRKAITSLDEAELDLDCTDARDVVLSHLRSSWIDCDALDEPARQLLCRVFERYRWVAIYRRPGGGAKRAGVAGIAIRIHSKLRDAGIPVGPPVLR